MPNPPNQASPEHVNTLDLRMTQNLGTKHSVVNESREDIIGRPLVPFFLGDGDQETLNESLTIPADQDPALFRSLH